MSELLSELEGALRRADPELYGRLRAGASKRKLDDAERDLGAGLPDDLRHLYAWRDGQTGKGTFPAAGQGVAKGFFLPLSHALEQRATLRDQQARGDFPEGHWPPSWLPVIDGGQGDFLCVDLDGGGVVEFRHETARRPVLFPSVRAWIGAVTDALADSLSGAVPAADDCVAAYLEGPSEPARSWSELRQWIRGLKSCGSVAVFARLALALDETPRDRLHPVMRNLTDAVERWLAAPSAETRSGVREALEARNRKFVPRQQVSFAAQHAAAAAVSGDVDSACDGLLHVIAETPGIVDGDGPEAARRRAELQDELRAVYRRPSR